MFKIAIDAGHSLKTAGKRLPEELDPNQTREWVLNDRVARYIADAAKQYEDVETLRVDDPTGKKEISLAARCKAANNWGADMYISPHHNAAKEIFTGGGIVAFSYREGTKAAEYRDAIYAACIAAGGLRGDRSDPTQTANFYVLKHTKAPAVLMEYGFMNSTFDYKEILQESYSKLVGYATMEGIAEAAGLKKKAAKPAGGYSLKQFVKDVQKAIGAEVDGIPGPETLSKTVTVSATKNRTHAVVKAIQKRLAALGYTQVGETEGIAGAKFTNAVKALQADYNCAQDGEITAKNKTWKVLLGMI